MIIFPIMDQMMGNLFYCKVAISEIKKMPFWELKYWNEWHERIQNKYSDVALAQKMKAEHGG